MGQEIFYCWSCSNQLRSSDFDKRKGFRLGSEAVCSDCAPDAVRTLPPEKAQALSRLLAAPKGGEQPPRSGTGRVPLADLGSSTRRMPAQKPKSPVALVVGGGAVVVLIFLGILAAGSSKPSDSPRAPKPAPPAPPPVAAAPDPALKGREDAVRAALQRAVDFQKERPDDPAKAIELYEQAEKLSRGTAFEADARQQVDAARRRLADAVNRDLAALEAALGAAWAKADFKAAAAILEDARKRQLPGLHLWEREMQSQANAAYAPIRAEAAAAAGRKDEAAVKAARAKVAAWGIERLTADFDRAVADAGKAPAPPPPAPPPPPPPPPTVPAPNAEAAAAAWDAAMLKGSGRDFAPAISEMEKLQSPADVELLRAVAALHAEIRQSLLKLAPGKKLAIAAVDFDGRPHKYEGLFVRFRDGWVEYQSSKAGPSGRVPFGFVLARSFAALAPKADRKVLTAACLLEGDLEGAGDASGAPPRWADWGKRFAARGDDKAVGEAERGAGYDFYFGWMAVGEPSRLADGALAARKLLAEKSDRVFTMRNREMIQALADGARDYVAGPGQLRGAGMFRLEPGKTQAYWVGGADMDPALRKQNYVEMDFSVLPEHAYRAWAYVGGCCAETLAIHTQGSEMQWAQPGAGAPVSAEPNSETAALLKHAIQSSVKSHSGHGARKTPTRWGWVEIPLPKYATAGAKSLRLVHHLQGFAVGWIVVSATREQPPTEAELKAWDKELDRAVGPAGPTLDLRLWLRADAGVAHEGGKVAAWADGAEAGRSAAAPSPAARPTLQPTGLNGKPAIRFDGASSHLVFDLPVNGRPAMTMTMVASPARNQADYEMGNYAAIQWAEYGPWGSVFLSPQQAGVAWRYGTSQWGNLTKWDRPGGAGVGPLLVTVRKDGPREDLFVQGARVHGFTDRKSPIHHTGSAGMIGAGASSPGNPLQFYAGDIAEIVVFGRALPEPERDALERHLRAKYGF